MRIWKIKIVISDIGMGVDSFRLPSYIFVHCPYTGIERKLVPRSKKGEVLILVGKEWNQAMFLHLKGIAPYMNICSLALWPTMNSFSCEGLFLCVCG